MKMDSKTRERKIYQVTLAGTIINALLIIFKFIAGFAGTSAAMIADAIHSLSDFVTDIVLLIFAKISNKPKDKDHNYGHGKYETLATTIIGLSLLVVACWIAYGGILKISLVVGGGQLRTPGWIALAAAFVSVAVKEWTYHFTIKIGNEVNSKAVIAKAWDHRSDALSSVGTLIGIGGAIILGHKWVILDPIAALFVSIIIFKIALKFMKESVDELMEKSLPEEIENEIKNIVIKEPGVYDIHNLKTRNIGDTIAIEMHIRMPASISLYDSHEHATNIEKKLRYKFGERTHITLHVEPLKINGKYQQPDYKH